MRKQYQSNADFWFEFHFKSARFTHHHRFMSDSMHFWAIDTFYILKLWAVVSSINHSGAMRLAGFQLKQLLQICTLLQREFESMILSKWVINNSKRWALHTECVCVWVSKCAYIKSKNSISCWIICVLLVFIDMKMLVVLNFSNRFDGVNSKVGHYSQRRHNLWIIYDQLFIIRFFHSLLLSPALSTLNGVPIFFF